MLPYLTEEKIEEYYICLLEARVKFEMTMVELEVPGTYERYLKLFYFDRKCELYNKLINVSTQRNTRKNHVGWKLLTEAVKENEERYAGFKKYWTFK